MRSSTRHALSVLALASLTASCAKPDRTQAPAQAQAAAPQSPPVIPPVAPRPTQPTCSIPALGPHEVRARSSGPVDASDDGATLVALDPDSGTLVVLAREPSGLRELRRFPVGARPAHVLLAGEASVLVSERGAGTVSAYDPRTGARQCTMTVPADPFALALSADAQTLYVSSAATARVTALALRTGATRWSTPVAREPRGLLSSADGARLFVTHAVGQPLSALTLGEHEPADAHVPPAPFETRAFFAGGDSTGSVQLRPAPSQAWSLARDPRTGSLLLPLMGSNHHVTHSNTPGFAAAFGDQAPGHPAAPPPPSGYGSGSGDFFTDVASPWVGVFDPSALRWRRLTQPQRESTPRDRRYRSEGDVQLPFASAWDERNRRLLVCSAGTNALATVYVGGHAPGGYLNDAVHFLPTLDAPDGVLALPDGALVVHSSLAHALELVPPAGAPTRVELATETLEPELALGRRLFFSGSHHLSHDGVSCAHCHPDGRDDGLRWDLGSLTMQTPTLAAQRLRAPFGWQGTAATLPALVRLTTGRLGGHGVTEAEVQALSRYLEHGLPAMPVSDAGLEPARVAQGQALFAGAGGCAGCHPADAGFTDAQPHRFGPTGPTFDTPSLLRVGSTPPYFHDGRYDTLDAMLADSSAHMGQSASLAPDERAALRDYLRSL